MSASQTPSSQILIVGAGPTGLVLAASLLSRGIPVRIIDKAAAPAWQSRAVGLHARSLEVLDTMGLAETFIAHGHQVHRFRICAGRRSLLNLDLSRNGSRFGFILHLPQTETERLLRARVDELGGAVEQGVELLRLSQQDHHVEATLRDAAGHEIEVSARYVVGCDGAHSRVRHELGLAFAGQPYPNDWLLADVTLDGIARDDEIRSFYRANGLPLVCLPMGDNRWRLVMPNAGDRAGRPPSFEEIEDFVAQRAPWPIEISDPGWLATFRCQLRSVASYRCGRVLLAGDAAHIHSPAGGQGMNTGMADAHNLAWKLALVANGAPEALLDTYGQERVPVTSEVLRLTDKMIGLATMRHPVKRAARNAILPMATRLPAVQKMAARRLSQMSLSYPPSPVVRPGTGRGPRPGERMPDLEVRTDAGPMQLHRALGQGRHLLLVSDAQIQAAFTASGLEVFAGLVDVVNVGTWSAEFALVRPDGILAARGSVRDVHVVIDYLQNLSAADALVERCEMTTSSI
jgi:2-polyprenyl-6-methoxyphenol hydroxylase-like FAD-dependent oxidoreductase